MKKRILSSILALSMILSVALPNVTFARYSNSDSYEYKSTNNLEIGYDGDSLVLTWPAVDKDGNIINANPLVASNGLGKDPMGSWTMPTQGMIVDYSSIGWTIDGSRTNKLSISDANKFSGDFPVIMGLNKNSPNKDYPVNLYYYDGAAQVNTDEVTYIDNTVVAKNYATSYLIEYSIDGNTWITDHNTTVASHQKKLLRTLADGSMKNDAFNTVFFPEQFVETIDTSTLLDETTYKVRVSAYDTVVSGNGQKADTSKNPYKIFTGTFTTPKAPFKQIAFPTVEGGGIYSQGGRGGDVYVVTNLSDSVSNPQPGSLRYGLLRMDRADKDTKYPRTIVFAVGGTIMVDPAAGKSERRINFGSNTTVAGQTAPGDGITIAGMSGKFIGEDIIIRYLNFMLGDGYDVDGATASGKNIVIDHCTFMMGVDETFTAKELENSSLQYNIIADALYIPNKNGANNTDNELSSNEVEAKHGMGSIWNGYETTFTHNFFSSNGNRSPRFEGAFTYNGINRVNKMTFANNVVYNWGHGSSYGGDRGEAQVNFLNNYYKPGPSTLEKVKSVFFDCDTDSTYGSVKSSYYIDGNIMEGNAEVTANNVLGFKDIAYESNTLAAKVELTNDYVPETAEEAYKNIINHVGASHQRNAYNARLIDDLINNTGRMVNTEAEITGFDMTEYTSDIIDTDLDGMPDAWETERGLNPNDKSDAGLIITDEASPYYGYSNIEIYINNLTGEWTSNITQDNTDNPEMMINVDDFTAYKQEKINVTYTAKITGNAKALQAPEFYLNDIKLNKEEAKVSADFTNGEYILDLTNIPYGEYYLQGKIKDSNGMSVLSKMIPVTIVPNEGNIDGFTASDVGNVKLSGKTYLNSDKNSIIMTGNGMIGYSASTSKNDGDYFYYNYIKATGDISLSAKVDDWSKIDTYQKAGIMIRDSLDIDSEFYMSCLTYLKGEDYSDITDVKGDKIGSKDLAFFGRSKKGGAVFPAAKGAFFKALRVPLTRINEEPNETWVKVEKIGQNISILASLDGTNWTELYNYESTLGEEFYIGFAVEAMQDNYDGVRYNRAEFSNIKLETPTSATLWGDVDLSGDITANDAAITLQYVLNPTAINLSEQALSNATIRNGVITAANAADILQKALVKTFKFAVENK